MRVWSFLVKDARKVERLLALLSPLFDAEREDLTPKEFWTPGTYFRHRARPKALVVNLAPAGKADLVALGRRAAGLLGERTGLILDWAGGVSRDGRRAVLVVKTLAGDAKTGRNRELRATPEVLREIARLAPGEGRKRER
jgi:hypothetical protein